MRRRPEAERKNLYMIATIIILLVLSTLDVAFIFYRIIGKRKALAKANHDAVSSLPPGGRGAPAPGGGA